MALKTLDRTELETAEHEFLASYAVRSGQTRGRKFHEKEHTLRSAFQRDRDRIVYSTAFRRLEYKTQVFVNHEGDHYRTRLTHTMEMSLISRTIGRALKLNEDLIEAIALAHDLGHGPFGHAGQQALSGLMKRHGGFEHNRQCLRLVEELEESYSNLPGLNLTFEVRQGLNKHNRKRARTLEADVVDAADAIAYNCHDLDDGLRAGLLDVDDVREVELWREVQRYIEKKYKKASKQVKIKMSIRFLMNQLVSDLLTKTTRNIQQQRIERAVDYERAPKTLIEFSEPTKKRVDKLKAYLWEHLYQHYRVVRMTEKGQRFIQDLFRVYVDKPKQLPPHVLKRAEGDGLHRAVCDYIAGMTDRFALDEHQRFFTPHERV